jgi:hypothetical protein
MVDNFKYLTEKDRCSVCDCAVQIVVEKTGRGTTVRHSKIYHVHEDPDNGSGVDKYYLHFNQRP